MGDISPRGVYYDLSISPYEYRTPYGDIFKFSSRKKLEIYERDIAKEMKRIDDVLARHGVVDEIPDEIIRLIKRVKYRAFYEAAAR